MRVSPTGTSAWLEHQRDNVTLSRPSRPRLRPPHPPRRPPRTPRRLFEK